MDGMLERPPLTSLDPNKDISCNECFNFGCMGLGLQFLRFGVSIVYKAARDGRGY